MTGERMRSHSEDTPSGNLKCFVRYFTHQFDHFQLRNGTAVCAPGLPEGRTALSVAGKVNGMKAQVSEPAGRAFKAS